MFCLNSHFVELMLCWICACWTWRKRRQRTTWVFAIWRRDVTRLKSSFSILLYIFNQGDGNSIAATSQTLEPLPAMLSRTNHSGVRWRDADVFWHFWLKLSLDLTSNFHMDFWKSLWWHKHNRVDIDMKFWKSSAYFGFAVGGRTYRLRHSY